ncbi:MAG: RES family NAD+ phosphorylase [Actinomycetota bacterium]
MADDAPSLAFAGYNKYLNFANAVQTQRRYILTKDAHDFLSSVAQMSRIREASIRAGEPLFRARLGCRIEQVERKPAGLDYTVMFDEELPFNVEGMKPTDNWQNEGRANPRGISYLYTATDANTACAEVRPWVGQKISVATLVTNKNLHIVDCSHNHNAVHLFDIMHNPSSTVEDGIWLAIDRAFAKPVTSSDNAADYIPTQIIAEQFKALGYDGIKYKSTLTESGYNILLFDKNLAYIISCTIYETRMI